MKEVLGQCAGASRREWLKRAAGLAAAVMVGRPASAVAAPAVSNGSKRVLRVAHLSDIHIMPEHGAVENFTACLHHVQEHQKPDLIVSTGDAIRDSLGTEQARVKMLWDLSMKIWKSECSVPVEHGIGNHDIFGPRKSKSKATGKEPLYGKKWIMSIHGWERTYRSFDRAGWHFIALDSMVIDEESYAGYSGRIDPEQFEWLEQDLAKVDPKMPILVFCHIPILSAAAFFKRPDDGESGDWEVPASVMSADARRLKNLFYKHPNVKVCLSGHLHLYDRVDYLGVSYVCGGAVAGGWWRGKNQEFEPAYNLMDLYADGTFENKYVPYGWKPQQS